MAKGGKREGAGRKPEDGKKRKEQLTIHILGSTKEELEKKLKKRKGKDPRYTYGKLIDDNVNCLD